ncbi:MAG: S8 family serine peptidase [Planctomycetaceae bacterium]|jgi:subtilisin family serine protease|nr:S8 family serine peptidase [Planctomycetaceae bacterium]
MRRTKRVVSSFRKLILENLEIRNLLAADFMPGELVIQYDPQMAPSLIAMNQSQRAEILQEIDPVGHQAANIARIRMPVGADVMAMAKEYQKLPGVLTAEPNYILKKAAVSNDTSYLNGQLWGMYSNDSPAAFGGAGTTNTFGSGAEEAWGNNYLGSSEIVVGIIDEGLDPNHVDLQQNVWVNPNEIANDGVDNDGNGRIDDVNGWDFFNNDKTIYDGGSGDTHGTHVAGTIGAVGGNGIGVAGVAWNVKMISAKFLGPTGGSITAAIQAIDYLTDLKVNRGVNIVATNNSWGGGGYSSALHAAIIRAANAGILFVAAAGNAGANNDTTANYPSNYSTLVGVSGTPAANYEAVIAVAATTSTGGLASFSNFGATQVDIGAPGNSILSTLPGNTYGVYSGTSMATPHVTGAIAAYAAAKPNASAATIREAILKSAVPTASLAGKTVTGGRLSVLDAINYVSVPTISIASASAAESVNGVAGAIEFKVTLSAPLTQQITVNYGTSNGTAAAGLDYTSTSGTLTFAPGETVKPILVDLINDNLVEPNETFFVDLSGVSSSAVALGTSRATGTIVNDDSTQISINDVAALENAGTFRFTVSLSRPSASTVTVRVATANGTARSGKSGDYNAISGTLSFAPGVVSQTVSVTVRNDTTVEPNETFFVNLSSASGATIADSQGIGTILNEDGVGGVGGPSRFLAGGSPDSLSANDWMDLLEGFGRRRGQRR